MTKKEKQKRQLVEILKKLHSNNMELFEQLAKTQGFNLTGITFKTEFVDGKVENQITFSPNFSFTKP